jgi:hypothetical protein
MSSEATPATPYPTNADYGQKLLGFAVDEFIGNRNSGRSNSRPSERDRPSPYPQSKPPRDRRTEWPVVHGGAAKLRHNFANNIRGQFLFLTDELRAAAYNPYVHPDTQSFKRPVYAYDSLLFREHRNGMKAMDRLWTPSFTLYGKQIVYVQADSAPPQSRDVWKEPEPAPAPSSGDIEMEVTITTGEAANLPTHSLSNSTSFSSPNPPNTNSITAAAPSVPSTVQTPVSAPSDAARTTRSSTTRVVVAKE